MDCVNRDKRAIGTTTDEVHDRTGWRRILSAAATSQLSGRGYMKKNLDLTGWFQVEKIAVHLHELDTGQRVEALQA